MNRIILKGRLTADPEVKTTQSGINVCTFTVAVDRAFKGQDGTKQTDFFTCTAWRERADFVKKYFLKGKEILLSGSMQSRKYEAKDGSNRTAWDVVVDSVEFCGPAAQVNAPKADGFEELPADEALPF